MSNHRPQQGVRHHSALNADQFSAVIKGKGGKNDKIKITAHTPAVNGGGVRGKMKPSEQSAIVNVLRMGLDNPPLS